MGNLVCLPVSAQDWSEDGDAGEASLYACGCGSGHESWWEHDARGIPLARVCEACIDSKLAQYRPDVFTDPDYWADEDIDSDY